MPGRKITMLPPEAIERFSLTEGAERPACSLYFDLRTDDFAVESNHTRVERVRIAANLRHQEVEELDAAFLTGTSQEDIPYSRELNTLWRMTSLIFQISAIVMATGTRTRNRTSHSDVRSIEFTKLLARSGNRVKRPRMK